MKVSHRALSRAVPFEADEFGQVYRRAEEEGNSEVFEETISLFARTIVNSMTILAPNRVVLFGSFFRDMIIRDRLIEACERYDSRYNAGRILYSTLADRENIIGPVAVFVHSVQ